MDKIDDLEKTFKAENDQYEKIKELEKELYALRRTLEEYGIDTVTPIDDVEYICIKGIEKLKPISEAVGLTKEEAATLDLLHKNLRMARSKMEKKELNQKTDIKDLLRIVDEK